MGQVTILPYLHKKGCLILTTRTSRVMQVSSIKQSQVCTTNETRPLLNHISNYQKFMLEIVGKVRTRTTISQSLAHARVSHQLNIHKTHYQY